MAEIDSFVREVMKRYMMASKPDSLDPIEAERLVDRLLDGEPIPVSAPWQVSR